VENVLDFPPRFSGVRLGLKFGMKHVASGQIMDDTRSESGEICGRYKPYNYQTEDAAYNCVRWIRVSEVLSNPASADTGQ